MIEPVRTHLRCPLCAGPLAATEGSLRCPRGHSFDLARQGYANLLAGRAPVGADTAAMVAARAEAQAAGLFDLLTQALAETAARLASRSGLVVDVGAGTGHYLAAVLDALPGHHGLAVDVSAAAARRAARAHPRAAAIVADAWRGLPIADDCADLVLNVFAPRNGPEFHRVLEPTGNLLVVTPRPEHLGELIAPLGLLSVDSRKAERLEKSLGAHFTLVEEQTYAYRARLDRREIEWLVAMGPSSWHAEPARVAAVSPPLTVTLSVNLARYRPLS